MLRNTEVQELDAKVMQNLSRKEMQFSRRFKINYIVGRMVLLNIRF
jgi:hypothetical protein